MYALIQKHKRLAAVIIAIASLSFLFWMFSVADIQQIFGLKRCAAEVNGKCITLREFRYELLKYSDLLDREELRSIVKRRVLFSLISREVLYQKALELGVVAPDVEVARAIKSDPSFQSGGKFNLETYKTALERIGLTPAEYELYLKKQLTAKKLIDLVIRLVYITDMEREFQRRIISTRFEGKLYLISPDTISVGYKLYEEEVKSFYERNKEKFMTREKKIYLLWKTNDKKKAHSLYSSVKKGEIPGGGEEVRDATKLPREVVKELERLSENNRFTITKVGRTYYVLYLKEVKPKKLKPLSNVKKEVVEMLKKEKALELAENNAWEIKEKLEKGDKVDIKPLEFESSSVDEFINLFRIRGEETLRLVFSKDKVFGPYRTPNGYAVVYIDRREVKQDLIKNPEELESSLKKAKGEALVNMFVEKLVGEARVKINEEYLK